MSRAQVQHVLRAPLVGGSELETATICRHVRSVQHSVIFPERYAEWPGRDDQLFPESAAPLPVPSLERAMAQAPGLVHLQFPFLLVEEPEGHDSVLELTSFPRGRTIFTVHAAVNVPIVDGLHYLFHTASLARKVAPKLDPDHVTVCPSLVAPPAARLRRQSDRLRLLWVSRNEEAKFHDELPWICDRLLALQPELELRMIGRSRRLALPKHPRLSIVDCPAESLAAEYAAADLFWYFPHARLEETWCRTVTEAMSFGLPVVVAGWGAMAEQLAGGEGLVVHEPAGVVDAVARFARDARARAKASVAARRRADVLFEEAHATLTSLYQRLLNHDQT